MTRGGDYGIQAMVVLAGHGDGRLTLAEVSSRQGLSEAFLGKVMQELARAGLVLSFRGRGGGFQLARPADEISVREVIEAIDGPLALHPCLIDERSCKRIARCVVRPLLLKAQNKTSEVLDGVSLAKLAKQQVSLRAN